MGSRVSKGKNVKSDKSSTSQPQSQPEPSQPQESDNQAELVTVVQVVDVAENVEVKTVEVIELETGDALREEVVFVDKSFSHQTGGHVGAFTKLEDGKIRKKVGKNEHTFYSTQLALHDSIREFVPHCHGTDINEDIHYIMIEDLTHRFKKPCILDIKMGTSSVGEDASPEKKEAMQKKDMGTTTHSLGIRITAMKVYQHDKQDYVSYGKDWGKNITAENFVENLKVFFHNGKEVRGSLIPLFVEKLKKVQDWINSQRSLRIYSSSLLFIYDGEEGNDDVELKMIDFAHVHEITDGGQDDGYITGMKNLIEVIQAVN